MNVSCCIPFGLILVNDMHNPPLKRGRIGIRDEKCADTYEKQFSHFCTIYFFEIWSILYSNFLENWPKHHDKWSNYWFLIWFLSRLDQNAFQKILRKLIFFQFQNIFRQFFLLKIIWNVCKKYFIKIEAKNFLYIRGTHYIKLIINIWTTEKFQILMISSGWSCSDLSESTLF